MKKENMDFSNFGLGLFYDLMFNPQQGWDIYAGGGLRARGTNIKYNNPSISDEHASGIGFGVRAGFEGAIGREGTIFFEINYDAVTGTENGENADLSSSGINIGARARF